MYNLPDRSKHVPCATMNESLSSCIASAGFVFLNHSPRPALGWDGRLLVFVLSTLHNSHTHLKLPVTGSSGILSPGANVLTSNVAPSGCSPGL